MKNEQKMNENDSQASNFSHLEKMIPKYCTTTQVALVNNNSVVLSMSYSESPNSSVLIERVVIDLEHASNLANILASAVAQVKGEKI